MLVKPDGTTQKYGKSTLTCEKDGKTHALAGAQGNIFLLDCLKIVIFSGDPLSNISMQLDFPSEKEAVAFCEKNNWTYEIDREEVRQIKPKAYGSNFHWSKRTRVSTK
jgi:hypothetical protein